MTVTIQNSRNNGVSGHSIWMALEAAVVCCGGADLSLGIAAVDGDCDDNDVAKFHFSSQASKTSTMVTVAKPSVGLRWNDIASGYVLDKNRISDDEVCAESTPEIRGC